MELDLQELGKQQTRDAGGEVELVSRMLKEESGAGAGARASGGGGGWIVHQQSSRGIKSPRSQGLLRSLPVLHCAK